jgi:hypothetical protein
MLLLVQNLSGSSASHMPEVGVLTPTSGLFSFSTVAAKKCSFSFFHDLTFLFAFVLVKAH